MKDKILNLLLLSVLFVNQNALASLINPRKANYYLAKKAVKGYLFYHNKFVKKSRYFRIDFKTEINFAELKNIQICSGWYHRKHYNFNQCDYQFSIALTINQTTIKTIIKNKQNFV